MNIIGEGFDDKILNQINQRQKIYGSANRSNQVLSYMHSKTGWCKLVSGADVKKEVRAGLGIPKAQDYVLFNGMVDEGKKLGTGGRAGISRTDSVYTNTAYGLGKLEFGQRAMPGIISANIKTETRGSLKTATVQIKAWNRTQFDIVDLLYLRLGYSILIEWGHSSYYDNSGTYIANNSYSLADVFLAGSKSYDEILETIKDYRLKSNGNYDALFGKVVNFSWSFGVDGSYDITVIIRSVGDVIESLKCNVISSTPPTISTTPTETPTTPEGTPPPEPTPTDIIVASKDKNSIAHFFYDAQEKFKTPGNFNFSPSRPNTGMSWLTNIVIPKDGKEHIDFIKQDFEGGTNGSVSTEYYIRLGSFLDFFELKVVPDLKDKSNNKIKSLKFNSDTEKNLILTAPRQISADPRICIFKKTFQNPSTVSYLFTECEEFEKTVAGSTNVYGKLMNIYLNCVFVLSKLDEMKDNEGNVKLIDFLQSLVAGICESTGNFNQLDVVISPNQDDLVTIIDNVPLPDRDTILSEFGISTTKAVFDVYGYYNKNEKTQNAGFIKDFQMKTEITPQMSSMITIGATANGNVVGQDSTALSRMNNGVEDRYKIAVLDPDTPVVENTQSLQEKFKTPLDNFNVYVRDLSSVSFITKPKWNLPAIDAYKSSIKDFLLYDQSKESEKNDKGSPTIGFLPFNLQLTIEGLSGMKVYQKYTIDTSFLPSNYPNNLDFLIKSVTHDISNNVWNTSIESIAVPNNISGTGGPVKLSGAADKASSRGGVAATATVTTVTSRGGKTWDTLSKNQKDNAIYLYNTLISYGFTDIEARAVLGIVSKESSFQPKNEYGYGGTKYNRLVSIWPWLRKYYPQNKASELEALARDNSKFYDLVYGISQRNPKGMYGNNKPGDGYKYRGRGFNQLTFKSSYSLYNTLYKKQGSKTGPVDIVTNPDLLNQADGGIYKIAAHFCALFFLKSKNLLAKPKTQEAANFTYMRFNAGVGSSTSGAIFQEGLGKVNYFVSKLPLKIA
jgi:hypothetical protein